MWKYAIGLLVAVVIAIVYIKMMKNEGFIASFDQRQLRFQQDRWKDAKLVMVQNVDTSWCLTYVPDVGILRLQPKDVSNRNQYWLYNKQGNLMQPQEQLCISYPGINNVSPIVNICDGNPGQQFIYANGKLINLTGLPYTAMDDPKIIDKQKMRCYSYYPTEGNFGWMRTAIVDCSSDSKQAWRLIEMNIQDYNAAKDKGFNPYIITQSNNARDLMPNHLILPFNTEKWNSPEIVRPYFKSPDLGSMNYYGRYEAKGTANL